MIKDNKNDVIRLRIESSKKKLFTEILKKNGDTPSAYLYRIITKYINENKQEL